MPQEIMIGYFCPECNVICDHMEELHKGHVYYLADHGKMKEPDCDNLEFQHTICPSCETELKQQSDDLMVKYTVVDNQEFVDMETLMPILKKYKQSADFRP